MTIKEYLDKNLLNINWNIFPQILEENDIELTEELKAYLKETPENTNWNILKQLISSNSEDDNYITIYSGTITTNDPYPFFDTEGEIPGNLNSIIVTFEENTYVLPKVFVFGDNTPGYGGTYEGGADINYPDFTNYPCFVTASIQGEFYIYTKTAGTYSVIVKYLKPEV